MLKGLFRKLLTGSSQTQHESIPEILADVAISLFNVNRNVRNMIKQIYSGDDVAKISFGLSGLGLHTVITSITHAPSPDIGERINDDIHREFQRKTLTVASTMGNIDSYYSALESLLQNIDQFIDNGDIPMGGLMTIIGRSVLSDYTRYKDLGILALHETVFNIFINAKRSLT